MIAAAPGQVSSTVPTSAARRASGTAASIGWRPATRTKRPASSVATMTSRQPSAVMISWRTGSASRNSLATSSTGPSIGTRRKVGVECGLRHRLELEPLQFGRAFDQVHFGLEPVALHRPQRIARERAAPGPSST